MASLFFFSSKNCMKIKEIGPREQNKQESLSVGCLELAWKLILACFRYVTNFQHYFAVAYLPPPYRPPYFSPVRDISW